MKIIIFIILLISAMSFKYDDNIKCYKTIATIKNISNFK